MVHGKRLIRDWKQQAKLERSPFIPFVYTYAAKLAGLDPEEMLYDPGKWSQSLLDAKRLLGYDGIVVSFDSTIEAEALGCEVEWDQTSPYISDRLSIDKWLHASNMDHLLAESRIPVWIETLKRIQKVEREDALCTSLTGIDLLLAESLGQEQYEVMKQDLSIRNQAYEVAQKAVLSVAKLLGECRIDLLFIRERNLDFIDANQLTSWYQPIINLLKYFRVPFVFVLETGQSSSYPFISYEGTGSAGNSLPMYFLDSNIDLDENEWLQWRQRANSDGLLITAGEVPWQTDVERIQDLMDLLS
jgi:uroporphyrinogen-III decarboxylase